MTTGRSYLRFLLVLAGGMAAISAPCWAWKPYTHVYLAEQAYIEAVRDGQVTIYKVDPATGRFATALVGGVRVPIVLAKLNVPKRLHTALVNSPAKFFAGVLGPDAYPDIVTGQMRIHPPGAQPAHPRIPDNNHDGPGTDAWLQALWSRAWQDNSDDEIAFAAGFLVHAAGDMYAHTFMNTYAGGIFDLEDTQNFNFFKHVTVEGYVAERTPELDPIPGIPNAPGSDHNPLYDLVRTSGVDGIQKYIAENTWDISRNGQSVFWDEANKKLSVPYHLATLERTLPTLNREMQSVVADLDSQLSHAFYNASFDVAAREGHWLCSGKFCPDPKYGKTDCPAEYFKKDAGLCAGYWLGGGFGVWQTTWLSTALTIAPISAAAHATADPADRWTYNAVQVLPLAMQDWVSASHNTAVHLFFTSDHMMHLDSVETHGLSVSEGYGQFEQDMESLGTGIPRGTVASINELIDLITTPVTDAKKAIGDAKAFVKDKVFQAMFHMSQDQAKQCFDKPHMWLNPLLRNNRSGMPGSLESLNKIMCLPPISAPSCGGAGDTCTVSASQLHADVSGACDILATGLGSGSNIARFSVSPTSSASKPKAGQQALPPALQEVFPAAFNALTMIKLVLADPSEVNKLAGSLALGPKPSILPSTTQPNAMLGFAATIDGSNNWLATREGADWGHQAMVFAQDCHVYRQVFLDQRPNYDAQGQLLTAGALAAVKPALLAERPDTAGDASVREDLRRWEPDDPPCIPLVHVPEPLHVNFVPQLVDLRATNGYAQIAADKPSGFSLASTGSNALGAPMTRGSVTIGPDGKSAQYTPPKWNPLGFDQILVTSKDGKHRASVPIELESPVFAAVQREPGTAGDPTGLRAGETAQLVAPGRSPMTWTIVSGPGTVGNVGLEAGHTATLRTKTELLAAQHNQISVHAARLADLKCTNACREQAIRDLRETARSRLAAASEVAESRRQLEKARATYNAPPVVTKEEIVTLKGVNAEGKSSIVKLRLIAPPPPLRIRPVSRAIKPGASVKLDLVPETPPEPDADTPPDPPAAVLIAWKVISGPGTIGEASSKERAPHAAQKGTFVAELEPLTKRLANAMPYESGTAHEALSDYIKSSILKYGPSLVKLEEIDHMYHAPQTVSGIQRVVIRGTTEDGSGRTVDVNFDIVP